MGKQKTEDHMEQDSNLPQEEQGVGALSVGDDDALVLMDAADDMLEGQDQGEEIIELTDLAEESPGRNAGLDGNDNLPDALDAEALEEEEIIELVDAVEDESEGDEEILDLTEIVENETSQEEEMPVAVAPAEEMQTEEGLVEDMGVVMEEETAKIPSEEETAEIPLEEETAEIPLQEETAEIPLQEETIVDSGPSLDMADIAMEETSEADETAGTVALAPEEIVSNEIPPESTGLNLEDAVREKLSDEKIEAVITKVVEDAVAEKADRILVEVAEAAIAREIEKIKKAL
jgi:hypothetical protein